MIPRALTRLVALLLIPALLVDLSWASVSPLARRSLGDGGSFPTQAISPTRGFYAAPKRDLNIQLSSKLFRQAARILSLQGVRNRLSARKFSRGRRSFLVGGSLAIGRLWAQVKAPARDPKIFRQAVQDLYDAAKREAAAKTLLDMAAAYPEFQQAFFVVLIREQMRYRAIEGRGQTLGQALSPREAEQFAYLNTLLVNAVKLLGAEAALFELFKFHPDKQIRDQSLLILAQKLTNGGSFDIKNGELPFLIRAAKYPVTSAASQTILKILNDAHGDFNEDIPVLDGLLLEIQQANVYNDREASATLAPVIRSLFTASRLLTYIDRRALNRTMPALLKVLLGASDLSKAVVSRELAGYLLEFMEMPEMEEDAFQVLTRIQIEPMTDQNAGGNPSLVSGLLERSEACSIFGDPQRAANLRLAAQVVINQEPDRARLLFLALGLTRYPQSVFVLLEELAKEPPSVLTRAAVSQTNQSTLRTLLEDERFRQAARPLVQTLIQTAPLDVEEDTRSVLERAQKVEEKKTDIAAQTRALLLSTLDEFALSEKAKDIQDEVIRTEVLRQVGDPEKSTVRLLEQASSAQEQVELINAASHWLQFSGSILATPQLLAILLPALLDPKTRDATASVLTGITGRMEWEPYLIKRYVAGLLAARLQGPIPINTAAIDAYIQSVIDKRGNASRDTALYPLFALGGNNEFVSARALQLFAAGKDLGVESLNQRVPEPMSLLIGTLPLDDSTVSSILSGIQDPERKNMFAVNRAVAEDNRPIRGGSKDVLDALLNRHVHFEHLLDIYGDETANPAARQEALELLARARDLSPELSTRWVILRLLINNLNRSDIAPLALQILGKLKDPALVRLARELAVIEAPIFFTRLNTAQPLIDVLEEATDPGVVTATLDLAAKSPRLATAQLTSPAIRTLLSSLLDPGRQANVLKILAEAGYKDSNGRLLTAESLINLKLQLDAEGQVQAASALMRFLVRTTAFRNILQDVFNDSFDYKLRSEALRLLGLNPQTASLAALLLAGFLAKNFAISPRKRITRRTLLSAV